MKKHRTLLLCLVVNACITPVLAQNSAADTAFIHLPSNYASVVDKKITGIDSRLSQQNEKYLKRLQKQEERLLQQLSRLDSSSAVAAFGNVKDKYRQLSEQFS